MVLHDQHVHTSFSFDSEELAENYIKEAIKRGCEYFVATNHFDINLYNKHNDFIFDIEEENKELKKLQEKYSNIKILHGIEVGYKYFKKDNAKTKKILQSYSFDLINLSVHDYKDIDFYYIDIYYKKGVDKILNIYFNQVLNLVKENPDYDVLSHIDYGFKTPYLNDKSLSIKRYENILKEIFYELVKNDKTLEINTKVEDMIDDKEHLLYILKLYKECGGKNLSLSSDAHQLNRYMISFDKYMSLIKNAGFDYLVYYVNRKKNYYKI